MPSWYLPVELMMMERVFIASEIRREIPPLR